ncbi:helix-turn-helix transcriptional regulator [Streptomyces sp. NRRL F-5650]|uniref:helix-turn-helix transcriptional regulator n=1 Tax=Streptomyces sp. NRRL F-5650 TaxID=1463868 RepID=UPI000A6390E5|nr:LuxR family transcriptional regulator [Streptomyces sp. NRRL F-5650]
MISNPVPGVFEVYEWGLGKGAEGFSADDIVRELEFTPEEGGRIIEALLEFQLVRPCSGGEGAFVPADPALASSQVLTRGELELLERKRAVSRLQNEMERLSVLFRSSKFGGDYTSSSGIVKSPDAVRMMLSEVAANTAKEVVCMQPGSACTAERLAEVREWTLQMLDRGVRMRVLYQHAARFDAETREHAAFLIDSGAEVRTAGALFGDITIFDRSAAYIPAGTVEGEAEEGGGDGAVVVQERSIVDFLHSCFEHVWATAKEFDTRRAEIDVISDDMKKEIVKMLISGAKDEAIARRLGVSVRTCRKHIGQVMQMFGAASRFQFGYLVKEANLDGDV